MEEINKSQQRIADSLQKVEKEYAIAQLYSKFSIRYTWNEIEIKNSIEFKPLIESNGIFLRCFSILDIYQDTIDNSIYVDLIDCNQTRGTNFKLLISESQQSFFQNEVIRTNSEDALILFKLLSINMVKDQNGIVETENALDELENFANILNGKPKIKYVATGEVMETFFVDSI